RQRRQPYRTEQVHGPGGKSDPGLPQEIGHPLQCPAEKSNGAAASIGVQPSNVVITTIKLDKNRRAILDRKDRKKTTASGDVEMVDP
ncbi:hypothetical protein K438DRAFT_2161021, partial [Mycena galopus ATCC 62051]